MKQSPMTPLISYIFDNLSLSPLNLLMQGKKSHQHFRYPGASAFHCLDDNLQMVSRVTRISVLLKLVTNLQLCRSFKQILVIYPPEMQTVFKLTNYLQAQTKKIWSTARVQKCKFSLEEQQSNMGRRMVITIKSFLTEKHHFPPPSELLGICGLK